jgi:hypothetical protein
VNSIDQIIEQYGADLAAFRSFDDDGPVNGPNLLPYATLVAARKTDRALAALAGVYEWQSNSLVFLADGDNLTDDESFIQLRRRLAMRGDAPYLGIVRPGQLTIHRVTLDNDARVRTVVPIESTQRSLRSVFPLLGNQRPGVVSNSRQWITNVLLRLLSKSIEELEADCGVAEGDAISLVGRALFTRFLGDRDLLHGSLIPGGPAETATLFDSRDRAQNTSQWLDDTFNGDLLPLSDRIFQTLSKKALKTLGDILRRAPGGQLSLEWEETWAKLDFAHIPVGVLSQAYEHYLRMHSPDKQRKEGSYYTPRIIANMMMGAAFHALRRDGNAHEARILDPASGAGIFLITAFRQIVAERWRHDQKRPETKTLREILYRQITGFDINESALRFAALGLYLMSIELDPDPHPVEKLKFEKELRKTVLHKFGENNSSSPSLSLGSLGSEVGEEHIGRYDLVIGNPPWASGTGLPDWQQVTDCVARIAHVRCPQVAPPKLPNEVLDLPFVWRAMKWSKPGGQIAFALHARLLFQQGEGMSVDRSAIFSALDVTGILNGAELRQSNVWPEISAPFCLLFAHNQVPPPGAAIRFVSPHLEDSLNGAGGLRVDAANAEAITSEQVIHRPEILKILFRGTQLDLEVYDRLISRKLSRLGEFWESDDAFPKEEQSFARKGYQKLCKGSKIKRSGDGLPGESAAYLWDLPELTPEAARAILVDASRLPLFSLDRVHRGRPRELYLGPKLIVHQSPPVQASRIRVTVADTDLVFSESYYGYSAKKHPEGRRFVRYLAMLVGSKYALWYALVTSGKFGFERDVIEKFVIDSLPVPPFDELDSSQRKQIDLLFKAVAKEDTESTWERVDDWAASLCGLGKRDQEVISDTLKFNLPFAENRKDAQTPPTSPEVDVFCTTIFSELNPLARRFGKKIAAVRVGVPIASPWEVVRLSTEPTSESPEMDEWPEILRIADQNAATEVIYPDPEQQCLWLARLSQARYWSRSQARLTARRVAWEHLDALIGNTL